MRAGSIGRDSNVSFDCDFVAAGIRVGRAATSTTARSALMLGWPQSLPHRDSASSSALQHQQHQTIELYRHSSCDR
jgi:hypothetical protein